MSRGVRISDRWMFGLGLMMGLVAIISGVLELRDSEPGFSLLASLFSIFLMLRSSTVARRVLRLNDVGVPDPWDVENSASRVLRFQRQCGYVGLSSFAIAVILVGVLEIASKAGGWMSNSYGVGLVLAWVFLAAFVLAFTCGGLWVAMYVLRKKLMDK